ncbi:MAG: hypothetical protein IJ703_06320 [Eubacterium sp.]|nr:hypothetical protein [Eubacterium sp.]
MRYVYTLQKYKKRMQHQLYQKTALLDRYALKGYISKKIIDDREYKYLQYHNEVGELISVFLNDTNYELFLEASRSREQIERRIKSIAGALAMMKSVPTVDENNNDEKGISGKIYGFRLLDKSVGISNVYHVLYRIVPKEQLSVYEIVGTYKKKKYRIPMIYVNERMVGKIDEYMKYAGYAIDEAVSKDYPKEDERSTKKIHGITGDGTKYVARKVNDRYDVRFTHKQKEFKIEYKPEKEYTYLRKQIYQMHIERLVEDYINEQKLNEALRRLS